MARRRNHGHATSISTLAAEAIGRIVPRDRMRLTRVQIAWPEIVPRPLERVAWPASVDRGVLTLAVLDNQWLHELVYLQADLLAQIRARVPEAEIVSLRARVGPLPRVRPEPPPPPEPPIHALPDEPEADTLTALSAIDDPVLRQHAANARMALSARVRRG